MSDSIQQAYIRILEAENVRLQKENAILGKTSEYKYWIEEGAFHLDIFNTFGMGDLKFLHLLTHGPYTVKINLCMEKGEGNWDHDQFRELDKFIQKYIAQYFPGESIKLTDIVGIDFTVYDSTGVVFSVEYTEAAYATIKADYIDPKIETWESFLGDISDDDGVVIYGRISTLRATGMFEEILSGAKSCAVSKYNI